MIRIENVVLRRHNHVILDNASLTIQSAKFTALKVEKGRGASSIFKLLTGLTRPVRGQVFIDSQEVNKLKDHQISWLRSRRIGLIYDTPSLVHDLSVFENIVLPLRIIGMPKYRRVARVNEIAQEFGIFDILHKKANQIDKATQQIVAICRALSTDPDIIVADAPASLLSPEEKDHLFTILNELSKFKNRTVICVTHDDNIDEFADRVVNIKEKQFDVKERVKEQRFDDYKGIQRARYPLADKIHHAWNTITRNFLVNSMLLLLISIGMAISLSATNITESSWGILEDDINISLDTRQLDVDKGGVGTVKSQFSYQDQMSIEGLVSEGLAASYYENYDYTLNSTSIIPYDYETLTDSSNMISGTTTGVLRTKIDNDWMIHDNLNSRVSALPAHQSDIDMINAQSGDPSGYEKEYKDNMEFWNNIEGLLVEGNLPVMSEDKWTYKFTNGELAPYSNVGEVLITEEYANQMIKEISYMNDQAVTDKYIDIRDLPGSFMTFSFSYDDPLNAWEEEKSTPIENKDAYNRSGNWSSSTILRIAGVISDEIVPGSPIYMQRHVSTINNILMLEEIYDLYGDPREENPVFDPVLYLPGIGDYYGVYDYSIVNSDTANIPALVEKINTSTNLRIVGRESILKIVKSATDVSAIIVAVSWILLAIMVIALTIIFSTFLLELKEETSIMRGIGMTKLSTITNNIFVALLISLIVNSVANLLFIVFIIGWNIISSGESVVINWGVSYDMWVYGTVGFILLSFIPTYRSANIDSKH